MITVKIIKIINISSGIIFYCYSWN